MVPHDALIDAIWPGENPPDATRALRDTVDQLDARLGTGRVVVHTSGCALRVDDDELDARTFERLFDDGMRTSTSNPDDALATLTAALALWNGAALEDVRAEPFVCVEAERLENLRLKAIEETFELRLQRGEHQALVQSLEDAVASQPLRERLTGQLMLALYRCGRENEAVRAYEQLRKRLAETLRN